MANENNNNSGVRIIPTAFALKALREGNYKELSNNIAELIDNSIEENAENIHIVGFFEDTYSGATNFSNYTIKSITVLDDGDGMDDTTLQQCLALGFTDRDMDNLKLGKFGYGLKGATINLAKRVEVFSWQNGYDKANQVYLDYDEVTNNDSSYFAPIASKKLPEHITKLVNKEKKTGCCVHISKLDKIRIKTPRAFSKRNKTVSAFATELSRIFRHFLDNDDSYGKKRNIVIHTLDLDGNDIIDPYKLTPNDPMFLLEPNYFVEIPPITSENDYKYLQDAQKLKDKATNYLYGEDKVINVRTHDHKDHTYIIRKSIADPNIQTIGGRSQALAIYEKNTGISFVRAQREIQLGFFNHIAQSEARNRWWGIEVRFEPGLDEYFGVTHDKQTVKNASKMVTYNAREHKDELENKPLEKWDKIDYINQFRLTLDKEISDAISEMMTVVKARGAGIKKTTGGKKDNRLVEIVNQDVIKEGTDAKSQEKSKEKSEDEKIKELALAIIKEDSGLSEKDALNMAKEGLNFVINLSFDGWPGSVFLDKRYIANSAMGVINRDHPFFKIYFDYLNELEDRKAADALRIVLMAFIRAEDELSLIINEEDLVKLREKWGYYIEMLMKYAQ